MESKLHVGNLAYSTTAAELRRLFAQAGQVTAVELITDRASGQSKGFAFLTLATRAEAQKAMAMFNGAVLAERTLKVTAAKARAGQRTAQRKPKDPTRPDRRTKPKGEQPSGEPAVYRSKLGGFAVTIADARPTGAKPRAQRSGYQSKLGAFGTQAPPPGPRRRRGNQNP